MIVSFNFEAHEYAFEIPFERYKEIQTAIKASCSIEEVLQKCHDFDQKGLPCQQYIAYEISQLETKEKGPKDLDNACDYSDHL